MSNIRRRHEKSMIEIQFEKVQAELAEVKAKIQVLELKYNSHTFIL